jgi:TRAP-type uncharacterized transport system substrate-binding protein
MNREDVKTLIAGVLGSLAALLIWFLGKFRWPIAAVLVAICIGYLLWDDVASKRTKEVVLLLGPRGGNGEELAKLLPEDVQDYSSGTTFGTRYTIRREFTDGTFENLQRVGADRQGKTIAFAEDSTGYEAPVRTLLPLNEMYLHIIVRRDFLRRLGVAGQPATGSPETASLVSFGDVATRIAADVARWNRAANAPAEDAPPAADADKPFCHRFYLGPAQSGTRQTALNLWNMYGIKAPDIEATGIADFGEIRVALRRGDIDGAFYLGKLGTKLVTDIASDRQCTLLAITNNEGIKHIFSGLRADEIKKTIYSHCDPRFSPANVPTIYSRLVLVVPETMKDSDAHHLGLAFQQGLRSKFPVFPWRDQQLTNPDDQGRGALVYQAHPGTRWIQADQTPPAFAAAHPLMATVFGAALASVLLAFLQPVRNWADRIRESKAAEKAAKPEAVADGGEKSPPDAQLFHKLGELLAETEAPATPTKKAIREWRAQLNDLRRQERQLVLDGAVRAEIRDDVRDYLEKVAHQLGQLEKAIPQAPA